MESTPDLFALAAEIRRLFLGQSFGIVQFWGWAQVPANDQSYLLVSTHVEGDRLDLIFVHESHTGLPGVLSIWAPEGVEEAPADRGVGIALRQASRLRLDGGEAWIEEGKLHLKMPRGEGLWPLPDAPALVLAR
jgi:hypothetical protein